MTVTIPGSNWGDHAAYTVSSRPTGTEGRSGPSNVFLALWVVGAFVLFTVFGYVAVRVSSPKGPAEVNLVEKVALESAGKAVHSESHTKPEPATTTTNVAPTTTLPPTTVPTTLPPADNTAPTVNIPLPTAAPPPPPPASQQPPVNQQPSPPSPGGDQQGPRGGGTGGGGAGGGGAGGGPITTPRRVLTPR